MQLTPELEAELRLALDTYWNSYLEGDIETWASYLADEYHNIGTTREEVWQSKQEIVEYSKSVIQQLQGGAEVRNKTFQFMPIDPYVMVHELGDMFLRVNGEWTFYAHIRLTSLMEKRKDGWKILHQHGSYPDANASQGDVLGFDKIKTENNELREAVKRRTIDLEIKNQELAIEAAMEKVRSRSLAMQGPDEIREVAELLRSEMAQLGIEALETSSIYIREPEKNTIECWYAIKDVRGDDSKLVSDEMTLNLNDTWVGREMLAFLASAEEQVSIRMQGEHRKEWINYCAQRSEALKGYYGTEIPERTYHLVKFAHGFMGAASPGEISAESWRLLKRSAAVFSFAYTRFLDLRQSAQNAREAQIELGLERVRAKTMAMYKSTQLSETARVLFEQFAELGRIPDRMSIGIVKDEMGLIEWWATDQTGSQLTNHFDSSIEQPTVARIFSGWKEGRESMVIEVAGEELKAWVAFVRDKVQMPMDDSKIKGKRVHHAAYFSQGILLISAHEQVPDETMKILARFAKVFEQAYTRFLDLQKAEAQAREAQIEAALERVRSKTMAMQTSSALNEVIAILYNELSKLHPQLDRCFIMTFDPKTFDAVWWMASGELENYQTGLSVPYASFKPQQAYINAWKERVERWTYALEGEDKMTWDGYLFNHTDLQYLPEVVKRSMQDAPKAFISASFRNFGCITTGSLEPLNEQAFTLLTRFGVVFEQTYTRFVDLKQAEAQAREAQIEVALERVRAKAMAMHSSEDLIEVVGELRRQMGMLGQKDLETCVIHLHDESPDFIYSYAAIRPPGSSDEILETTTLVPKKGFLIIEEALEAYHQHRHDYIIMNEGDKLKQWFAFLEKESPDGFKKLVDPVRGSIEELRAYWSLSDFSGGSLVMVTMDRPDDHTRGLLRRFSNVFGLAYRRYADLKKAEAQAREAQIETALERVRSRGLGMQKSEELKEVIQVVYEQLVYLNIRTEHAGFIMDYKYRDDFHTWIADHLGSPSNVSIPYFNCTYYNRFNEAKANREDFFSLTLNREDKDIFYRGLFQLLPDFPEASKQIIFNQPGFSISTVLMEDVALYVENFTGDPYDDESNAILMRFAKVFQQTYTRFLDLQRAEAQAREAQIEAALERVRSKTMAMHNSADVGETAAVMVEELRKLGIETMRCGIGIMHEPGEMEVWTIQTEQEGKSGIIIGTIDMHMHPLLHGAFENWRKKGPRFSYLLEGDDLVRYYEAINNYPGYPIRYDLSTLPSLIHHNEFYFPEGVLFAFTLLPMEDAQKAIVQRFAGIFGQTYRRYLDLTRAEAQAREAQIEAALEKIRSRSLAMHSSQELIEVIAVVFEKMNELKILMGTVAIWLFDIESGSSTFWLGNQVQKEPAKVLLPYDEGMINKEGCLKDAWEARRKNENIINKRYDRRLKDEYFDYVFANNDYHTIPEGARHFIRESPSQTISLIVEKNSTLFVDNWTDQSYSEAQLEIFKRVARVFEQAYVRFLDLQKAEAQARESNIEAALERVRSKAMAMRTSEDIAETTAASFEELRKLGVFSFRSGVGILSKASRIAQVFADSRSGDNSTVALTTVRSMDEHPALQRQYASWLEQKDFEQVLRGDELTSYYSHSFFKGSSVEQTGTGDQQEEYGYYFAFPDGLFYSWSLQPYTEQEKNILHRFRNIIALTFRRYLDLQKAEAQARESQIEAALEKVRSRTLAMQHSDELAETAAVMFRQLIILGIAPNRLYIILFNEQSPAMEAWVTDEDGSRVSVGFTGDRNHSKTLNKMYQGWVAQQKSMVLDLRGEELQEYLHYLHDELKVPFKGGMEQKRRVQHVAYFGKGLIGIASPEPQPEETMQLLERFADVFNLTFTRFNDLKVAEAHAIQAEQDLIAIKVAKKKAEAALSELQATQKQLIQSEKMASLGELTAGIAHEIQNPLNFVNNFSEVSKELIDEVKESLAKGDVEDAMDIISDLVKNLERINEHGKRADSIVKGMLQHSRAGSGHKEPTDMSVLADECLRLAFHGLRAKDKSFNANFETVFDPAIGKIDVMQQDMGRVLLNLINNAFYTVNEKSKRGEAGYKPLVKLITEKRGQGVGIRVEDNGDGIPESIKEKIFQPFFTTKPTGQGTGLGLSLAYDIVKAHEGELTVVSKEGEGTVFNIYLPNL